MFKRLMLIITLGIMLSGCFMVPLALIAPATSGFTTASLVQSGISTGANYLVKKSTGKSIGEHTLSVLNKQVLLQTYFPIEIKETSLVVAP